MNSNDKICANLVSVIKHKSLLCAASFEGNPLSTCALHHSHTGKSQLPLMGKMYFECETRLLENFCFTGLIDLVVVVPMQRERTT